MKFFKYIILLFQISEIESETIKQYMHFNLLTDNLLSKKINFKDFELQSQKSLNNLNNLKIKKFRILKKYLQK